MSQNNVVRRGMGPQYNQAVVRRGQGVQHNQAVVVR